MNIENGHNIRKATANDGNLVLTFIRELTEYAQMSDWTVYRLNRTEIERLN